MVGILLTPQLNREKPNIKIITFFITILSPLNLLMNIIVIFSSLRKEDLLFPANGKVLGHSKATFGQASLKIFVLLA